MKGIVFTEFLEMVEEKFGLEVVDKILEAADLESGGIYTAVGTYDFNEMVSLLTHLSKAVDLPPDALLHTFGHYLFGSLGKAHPDVIKIYNDPLDLLVAIEDHIHVQVKKLYQDAELPSFTILERTEQHLSMVYTSSRGLYRLAHGLIEATFSYFSQSAKVHYELLKGDGTKVKFTVYRHV